MLDGKTHSLLLKCFFPAFFVLIKKNKRDMLVQVTWNLLLFVIGDCSVKTVTV